MSHENTGADPEHGVDHGDLKKEQKHATNCNKMTTSTTKTRKKTTVERWPKKLAHFFSDSLAMNDSTPCLLHFTNPIVASCDDAPQAAYEPFSPSLYLSSRKYMIVNEGNYWLEIFNLPITAAGP